MIQIRNLGRVDYTQAWELQKRLVEERRLGKIPDTLLLLEHPAVVTLGARAKETAPQAPWPVHRVERGGDITYHGPGQLVGYPIVLLSEMSLNTRDYLRLLESLLISALKPLGLDAQTQPGFTGVWAKGKKIASIGVAVKHWIAYHGFSLNVNMDLKAFELMHPCRLEPGEISDLSRLLRRPVELSLVRQLVAESFWQYWESRELLAA